MMIIQIIRFKSRLSHSEVNQRFIDRSDQYRKVPGLLQKYYVHFPDTREYGGVLPLGFSGVSRCLESWQFVRNGCRNIPGGR